MSSRLLALVAVVSLAAIGGCASGPAPLPTVATGENAEVTIEGLYRMDNTVFQLGFAKPDLDLSGYTGFILEPVTVAYQKDPGGRTRYSTDSNFALSERQMDELKAIFQEEVADALTEGGAYRIVQSPAADVLRLEAKLIDLVVRVPTDLGGREDVYASSYGAVTLIVELYDSQSGEILAAIGDRQDPTSTARELAEVNRTYMRSDVTRLFQHWAETMRERLDQLRAVTP